MKITIDVDANINETQIHISCNHLTSDIENIIATLRMMNQQLMVMRDEENYLIDVSKIAYIEALERKTFVYTEDAVYESKLKLSEKGKKVEVLLKDVDEKIKEEILDLV